MRIAILLVLLAACGGAPPPLAPARHLVGDWSYVDGSGVEHWRAVDGALWGIAFVGERFEVMVIDDDGAEPGVSAGTLRFVAMPGGADPVAFVAEPDTRAGTITFRNPAHDFPTGITYASTAAGALAATLEGPDGPVAPIEMRAATTTGTELATAVDAADRARGRAPAHVLVAPDGAQAATIGHHGGGTYAAIWAREAAGAWVVRFESKRP